MAEQKIEFLAITDKSTIAIVHPETEKTLAEITGYDVDIKFNMELINSPEDIDATVAGLGEAFKDLLLNNLLKRG